MGRGMGAIGLAMILAALLTGCPRSPVTGPDAGTAPTDGGDAPDSGVMDDAGPPADAGPPSDAGMGGPSMPTPPANVSRMGSGGYLLRGTVLAPTQVIDPGEVLVVGGMITCVAADCSGRPSYDTVTVIETNGIISPGLVDGHNHLTYDFLPEWVPNPSQLFGNRYDWNDNTQYEAHILPFSADSSNMICPGGKWGEIRSMIHGTTTVMGQSANRSCLDRLVRNADHHHDLGHDHMQTTIASPADITTSQAATRIAAFTRASNPVTRFAVHMAEGLMGTGSNIDIEFESFAGRDPRDDPMDPNDPPRHFGVSLLEGPGYTGTGLLIHSLPLTDTQLMEVQATNASIIWSPSSNLVLYGQTANIDRILELGITVGLGPDWTVSGEDEMLSEMRFAMGYAMGQGISRITPQVIWQMATSGSAQAVGLGDRIGTLEENRHADIVVFGRTGQDPFQAVLDSRAQDVRLVFIEGAAYYGDAALETATAVNTSCESIDACGTAKFVCVANTPGSTSATARATETVLELETDLLSTLAMYGRTDLLPLIQCAP